MTMGLRRLLLAVAFSLLCPTLCSAVPIVGDIASNADGVIGWQNQHGTFLVDMPMTSFIDGAGDIASYSTSSSLFSWSACRISHTWFQEVHKDPSGRPN